MSQTHPDVNGFKYVHLTSPIRLDVSPKPITIYPRGLIPTETYDVRASLSGLRLHETGSQLMSNGITLNTIPAGELIFLNLPHYPGSGTDHVPPTSPNNATKRLATNLGVQGIELSWSPSHDDNWLSYYQVRKNGKLLGRTAKGTFFFDHSDSSRNDLEANYEVAAVDGDGNASAGVSAKKIAREPATESPLGPKRYEALGDFSPIQLTKHWTYEETADDLTYTDLAWDKGGYEGRWTGSGLGRIGRIWMQPSAQYDLSRTFIVPSSGAMSTSGEIRKDPSANNGSSCFVRILLNSSQIWPSEGWAEVSPSYDHATRYTLANLPVKAGDKIRFVIKHNGANRADPIVWDPAIVIREPNQSSQ
jgi:hypothetical protein